jgi:myo-inositol 2-dehydrogenase/D-chiro-inositol 1-dehydrogenase
MRIGMIGVGRIGAFHARTLHSLAEVDELTVVDTDAGRARQAAEELRVAWGQDVGDLLAGGVDGVVIATPTATHAPLIRAAAEAGVAVFCEKPVAADVAETKEVVQLVE